MTRRLCIGLLLLFIGGNANADIFRPAYLEVREIGNDSYDVLWKVPALGSDLRLSAYVVFPAGTVNISEPRTLLSDGAWIERWQIRRDGGLEGETIAFAGSASGVTDIIARVERLDGSSPVEALAADKTDFTVRPPAGQAEVAWSYLVLGVEHILGGIDHLLFVLALLLIVRGGKRIIATVTAFTIAHSITLVSATMGWMHVPGPPVETIIALSIVFVAAEVIHGLRGKPGLTARAPWLVAFSFGLLHGFGFAGALAEVGLPQNAIPIALLMFNVGVEIGQILFVVAMLLLGALLGRLIPDGRTLALPAAAYGIGCVAALWTIERVPSFWS
ncbi:MAG: HupE/UreJ family protein [Proteobacteria bacterium]|nr:HupE/UreJ family protein [Pseudomonadota bacterium]